MKRYSSMIAVLAAIAMLAMIAPAAVAQDTAVPGGIGEIIPTTDATLEDVVIERLQYRQGEMLASGTVEYATSEGMQTQQFRNVPVEISQTGTCDILTLDLGPIFLDLLGLQVDLSPIELDITAVPGAGNLLGNLLCAVAGLLDPGAGGLGGVVDQLLRGLTRLVNQLLRGLGGLSLA